MLTPSLEVPPRRMRIRRLSRVMILVAHGASVLLPIGLLAMWLLVPAEQFARQAQVPVAWMGDFGLGQRLIGYLITMVPAGFLVRALWSIRNCFSGFARGELFTAAAAKGFRDFAAGLFLSAFAQPFAGAAFSVLTSWNAPEGQKQLAFAISSDTLLVLFLAALLAIVGWVLAEATIIADEHAQFV
ncbi:DUF2975 domain-containing protein [Devosia sp.]|uniref:DUF2975 domain-containing protein n=1 Tax=Devosia sp. TaxID=1871048 RepID=UPI003BAB3655